MKKLVIIILKIYKKYISGFFPPSCKYHPTCSMYAIEAIEKYGIFKGGLITIWRVLRCNPFLKGGYDPVK